VKAVAAVGLLAAGLFASPRVRAAEPFVDRALTLPVLHVSADAGIGFGQYSELLYGPLPSSPPTSSGQKIGWGASYEAAIGLPFIGELGARIGDRFNAGGATAQADHYARLFDPIVNEPGEDPWTNPEFYLRGTLVDVQVVQVGLETRVIVPTATGSNFAVTPGIPVRVHVPGLARIDTGVYFPIAPFDQNAGFVIHVPAQLFFQVHDAFVGPLTGFRYEGSTDGPNPEITAGVGGGYTLWGILDVKAQVYTDLVNDPSWANHIGGGVGVGLRTP
jgi:hypothetical protein